MADGRMVIACDAAPSIGYRREYVEHTDNSASQYQMLIQQLSNAKNIWGLTQQHRGVEVLLLCSF